MSHYKTHVFICTNQKTENKKCCANGNAAEMVAYAKEQAAKLGITKESKFRISSSGCMGRCDEGPVLAVYPQGDWYTYSRKEDIDRILVSVLKQQDCSELAI
jgi:(2Fe-2S) ferredoxin